MKFVPDELQKKNSPCWLIALNEKGETIDYLDRCGTQHELEEALTGWLRSQITRIDQQLATSTKTVAGGIRRTLEVRTNKPRETGHLLVRPSATDAPIVSSLGSDSF